MRIPLQEFDTQKFPGLAPAEYAGKWVAWNLDETLIVGSGETAELAHDDAIQRGHAEMILQKVPRVDSVFVGAT